jgi:hypothetical protein
MTPNRKHNRALAGAIVAPVRVLLVAAVLVALAMVSGCGSAPASPAAEAQEPDATSALPTAVPAPSATSVPARPTTTVYPARLTGYLPNPAMGWQDTQVRDKRFPETVGYVRDNWALFNPEEGVYDWSIIEDLRARMAEDNGQISFRIQTVKPPPWGSGHGIPDWLVEQGATTFEGADGSEPVYTTCLFLEGHGTFIDALRDRYDGDPDVAFIDIGSYGIYGEWHTEQYSWESDTLDWHARRRIIDMYLGGEGTRPCLNTEGEEVMQSYAYDGFQETQLIMPYTPGFSDPLRYALSRRQDIGIRHDALGSEDHQDLYAEEISELVAQTWPRAPIIFEFYPESYTPDRLRSARAFAEDMHASYIHENFDERGSDELIERILERVGYRLVLHEATYTTELRPGESLEVAMLWENTGIAPPYIDVPLWLALTDADGALVHEQQADVSIRDWMPNEAQPVQLALELPDDLPAGTYDLKLAFVDPATAQPALNLAIAGRDARGYYTLGPVEVLP